MTYPFGVDLSRYQYSSDGKQKPNFDLINEKCDFVAVRAGISWGYVDPWFAYSWGHLAVPRLAYHVIYPGEEAARQTDHFLNIVQPQANDRLVLDLELDHGQTKRKITDTLLDCLQEILDNTGRYPVLYSRAYWLNQYVYVNELPANLDYWLASYLTRRPYPLYTPERSSPPLMPNGVSRWFMHQTAERGNGGAVGVVSHYVDTNRFNGTQEELRAYFGLGEATPPEPPAPPEIIDLPPLSQRDPRWKDIKLGYSTWRTIGSDGCLVTDFAMIFGVTPAEFNARMQAVGGFTDAKVYWKMVKVAYPDSEYLKYIECYYVPAPLNEIDALLAQRIPVMVHVTRNGYMHWVTIIGKDGDDYIINDPIDGVRCSFRERYGNPARWILRIVAYRRAA